MGLMPDGQVRAYADSVGIKDEVVAVSMTVHGNLVVLRNGRSHLFVEGRPLCRPMLLKRKYR